MNIIIKEEILKIAKTIMENGNLDSVSADKYARTILEMSSLIQELDKELRDIKDILHGGHYC